MVHGQDGQREFERQGGSEVWQHQQSRFRSSSMQNLTVAFDDTVNPKNSEQISVYNVGKQQVVRSSVWGRIGHGARVTTTVLQPIASTVQSCKAGTASVQKTVPGPALAGAIMTDNEAVSSDSVMQRYVTVYFTNVPNMVPYFYVKEAFEVCAWYTG